MLGKTGIRVSQICFGSLTVSPLGAGLSEAEGAEVIACALQGGINFIDTAQYYRNYETIKRGISLYTARGGRENPVICTKTYAWNRELAAEAVDEARKKLGRDVIDVFLLHEQESIHTLQGHMEALEYLYECKEQGIIRAVGLSTHCVDAVYAAAEVRHSHGSGLDVVFPMFNVEGLGIRRAQSAESFVRAAETELEHRTKSSAENVTEAEAENRTKSGAENVTEAEAENRTKSSAENVTEAESEHRTKTGAENVTESEAERRAKTEAEIRISLRDDMWHAMNRCRESGIGVMLMKVFGGGHLLGASESHGKLKNIFIRTPSERAAEALRFAIDSGCGDSIALGMQSAEEVLENIRFFETGRFSDDFCSKVNSRRRRLVVEDYCEGCGNCVRRCGQGAMSIVGGTAVCDSSKCVLCGYCAGVCPHFAIKVI